MKPSVCARNATGLPCRRPPFGDRPVVRAKRTSDGFRSKTGFVTKPSVPEKVASTASCGRIEANALGCYYSMNTRSNMKRPSECVLKDKGVVVSPSPDKRSILPPRQTGSSCLKRLSNCGDSTKGSGVHQTLPPELRRRISERYLCGDKSFEENPTALSSPTRHEDVKNGSADLCDPSNTLITSSELVAADACLVKRKSTSGSENVRYPQENCKRQCVRDDMEGINEVQAPNETIDLNDTLSSFLNGPNESRGMRRSRGIAKRRVQGRPAGKGISSITSDDRCETNSAKKANYEPGVETHNITQPKIVRTYSLAEVAVKSREGNQTFNDGNKPSEKKNIGDVINAEKPVQRGLLKNTKSSLCGSYALDYESLPKLIGVLCSPMAKVVSNLKT